MGEILLDAFNPTQACLDPPPTNSKQADLCQVKMSFHVRGDTTTQFPRITFQREQDRFLLANSNDLEINLGLLRSQGFDEKSGAIQGLFLSSVGLFKWIERSYPDFQKATHYQGPTLLPDAHRMRNFAITGSLKDPDPTQRKETGEMLKGLLHHPSEERKYFQTLLKSLVEDGIKGQILPEMQPRIRWLIEMFETYDRIEKTNLPENDPAGGLLGALGISFLVYLGSGEGDPSQIGKDLDDLAVAFRGLRKDPSTLYSSLLASLAPLEKSEAFNSSKDALERQSRIRLLIEDAVRQHRGDLIGLNPSETLQKSLFLKVEDALRSGELAENVREEMRESKVGEAWLKNNGNLKEIFDVFLSSFTFEDGPKIAPPGHVKVDATRLKSNLEHLIDSHSVQNREYMIGALALIRHFFGKTLGAVMISVWVKDRYVSIPLEIAPENRKELEKFSLSLERRIRKSLLRTNLYLPLTEAGVCAAGLAMGGVGLGFENRGLTVGGFTTTGLGCGALITHYIIPTRNPYLSDTLGGVLGAAAAFTLSFLLKGLGSNGGPDGRNPVKGYGP